MAEGVGSDTLQRGGASEEGLLLERLRLVEENPAGSYAVHVYLSALKQANRKPHFIRIAARSFDLLVHNNDAKLFQLDNCDLVLICRDAPVDDIDSVLSKVRTLFSEDPLMAAEEGSFEDRFAAWYDLSQSSDFTVFRSSVEHIAVEAAQRRRRQVAEQGQAKKTMIGKALNPANLGAINHKMQETQILDLVRQQTAIDVSAAGGGQVVFREHYVSMMDLQQRVAPGVNLFGSTWLFQYLTETLDRRMLAVIARGGLAKPEKGRISINLNIGTVLSRDFQHFHRFIGDDGTNVVIEMQLIDIFSDVSSYTYARDSLQERGYGVLIDGLSPLTVQYFDAGFLKADFIKVNWSAEFGGDPSDPQMAMLSDSLQRLTSEKIILARVETQPAIKWGLGLGIHCFQGHFVDKLVQAMKAKGII
jgi:hypothetical protein